jgi:AcrR family transcriptional regulator
MPASVKSQPTRRARKALATRRRILEAAETLFTRDGYATTTIAAIADQADVAVQTIYAVFGTKRAVLSELLAVRVVGDDDATPPKDRDDWRAMESETDPRRQLDLLAAIATRIGERMGALYDVLAGAAGADSKSRACTGASSRAATTTSAGSRGRWRARAHFVPAWPRPTPPTSCGRLPTLPCTTGSSPNATGQPTSMSAGSPAP